MRAHAHQRIVHQAVALRGYLTLFVVTALLLTATFFVPVAEATGTILRVQAGASGANDGTSWANAFPTLQDALAVATSGQQIWVAAGIYYPDEGAGQSNNARSATFLLSEGVAIYGGFAGDETALEQRDWEDNANATILSGDIGTPGDNSDNAYHVVTGANNATLDGFTITAGNADGSNPNDSGGGVRNINVSPTLRNLTIIGNRANWNGGGVFNDGGTPSFANVTISGNQATNHGGGVYNSGGTPSFANVTISGNQADNGGGLANRNSNASFANSTIWGNSSQVDNEDSTPSYSYSLVQGLNPGDTNLPSSTDPRFVNPVAAGSAPTTDGNYRLQADSALINAGNDAAVPAGITTDLDGNPRSIGGTVDLGPYEVPFPSVLSISPTSASPTNAATVAFTVTFNMPVSGVEDSSNFSLVRTGGQGGAEISNVTGSATTWVVSVTTVENAEGTIGLNLVDDDSIVTTDDSPVPLGGPGVGNGDFTGEVYVVDRVAPTVTLDSTAPNPTNSTIPVTVTFSENVSGFVAGDVTVTNGSVDNFTGSGASYHFTVTPDEQGDVTVNIGADVAQDAAGNGNT
ncbi:Ig-like domain-containing protein, partial [Candidatus Viridilinea mediisalina]